MRILVADVGGTSVKVLATGKRTPLRLRWSTGRTPQAMAALVSDACAGWSYDVVSIGYPGPVYGNRPTAEPVNLEAGWVGFDYEAAFGRPVRMINDAAMQALGSYEGGRMLFLGLGTGLGTTFVIDGTVVPLEVGHLPYRKERSYEDYVGEAGLARLGVERWRKHVRRVVAMLAAAFNADHVVLGGGNVRLLDELPPNVRRGNNAWAFRGGYRLWSPPQPATVTTAAP